jgi:rare lipoprotein A
VSAVKRASAGMLGLSGSARRWLTRCLFSLGVLALGACASSPTLRPGRDGPPAQVRSDLDSIPDAVARVEPILPQTTRPYEQSGRRYQPMTALVPYRASGIASWYGRQYQGKKTASGELYDLYAMTAAHPILPIPSYARVTARRSGRSVVVRINDRGPFVQDRLIDLSYVAAHRIGLIEAGSGVVDVELILPPGSAPKRGWLW